MQTAEVLFGKALYDLVDFALNGVLIHGLLFEAKELR